MSTETDFSKLKAADLLSVNNNPIQPTAGYTLLRTATIGGPELGGDRRILLDKGTLLQLAEIAKSSPSQRVQVDKCGIKVQLFEDKNGHTFEVWTLIGLPPKPESVSLPIGI